MLSCQTLTAPESGVAPSPATPTATPIASAIAIPNLSRRCPSSFPNTSPSSCCPAVAYAWNHPYEEVLYVRQGRTRHGVPVDQHRVSRRRDDPEVLHL